MIATAELTDTDMTPHTGTTPRTGTTRAGDSFGIMLTEHWNVVPLEQRAFDAYRNDLIGRLEALDRDDWRSTDSRKLDLVLQKVRRELLGRNTRFAAVFFDLASAAGGGDPEALIAAVSFSVYTKTDFKTALHLTSQVLFSAFAVRRTDHDRETRVTDLEPPRLVDLTVGRTVHLRRLTEPRNPLASAPPFFAETFVLPLGDDGTTCGILQFVTPNIEQSRAFSEMFHQLACTMTVLGEGDPTVFNNVHHPASDAAPHVGATS